MNDKDVKFRVYDEWLCTCTWSSELYITTIACYKFVWVYTSQWHLFYLKCNCMCLYLIVIFVTIDFMCALLYMSVLDNFRVPREKPIPKSIDEMPKFEEKEKKVCDYTKNNYQLLQNLQHACLHFFNYLNLLIRFQINPLFSFF